MAKHHIHKPWDGEQEEGTILRPRHKYAWIYVVQPDAENLARLHVNETYGNHGWMSTYLDGPRWEDLKAKYAPGRCVATLEVQS